MDERSFLSAIEAAAQKDSGTVHLEDALDDIGWDSLAVILLIAELDSAGVNIEADVLTNLSTVHEVFVAINGNKS